MKVKPIIIVIVICLIIIITLFMNIIKNNFNKKNTLNGVDYQNSYSNDENNNKVSNDENNNKKVSKAQNEKVQDVYEHIMDEDWDYLWNKMIHYDNEIMTIEDLKLYFKSNIKTTDVEASKLKMSEQGYTIIEVDSTEDDFGKLVVATISNGSTRIDFGLYEKGSSKDNYDLLLDKDYSYRGIDSDTSSNLRGFPIIFPADIENIKIRNLVLKDQFKDVKYFNSYPKITSDGESIDYSKYSAYRVLLPMKTILLTKNEALMDKIKEMGVDIGNPEKIYITAKSKFGELHAPDGIKDLYKSQYGFEGKGVTYTADLYLKSKQDQEKVLNGLKDVLNSILNTYERTKTFQSNDYKKYFVDEFSDAGYKTTIDTLQQELAYPESGLKNLNRRVVGVVAEGEKIKYLGNNIFSFVPGTATTWDEEEGFGGGTTRKTCENMNASELKVEIQEDGSIKIKEVDLDLFSGLCLYSSDFEWNY